MRAKGSQVYIAFICLILGIMFAIQYNASNFYKASLVPTSIEDLSEQLQNLAAQKDTAEKKKFPT